MITLTMYEIKRGEIHPRHALDLRRGWTYDSVRLLVAFLVDEHESAIDFELLN